ncbi:MAG: hypothetical protein H7A45_03870 [Verrucomicrobiales bacterium]|nr:hypothetical protein [Verrucomicrobiales bacterium]
MAKRSQPSSPQNKKGEDAKGSFKPFPGTEVPMEVFSPREARWVIRVYLVGILVVMFAVPLGLMQTPTSKDSIWGVIAKALSGNFSAPENKQESNKTLHPTGGAPEPTTADEKFKPN